MSGRAPAATSLLERIERLEIIDRVADRIRPAASRAVGDGGRRDLLTGRWLGHPVHPAAVLVPTSCWLGATVLDVVGGRRSRPAAQRLSGLGLLTAVPAAASGAADWIDTSGAERRIGMVHAAGNLAAGGLYALSWSRRREGRSASATVASLLGAATLGLTGYLGGHLAYRRGVGVNTTAFGSGPSEWTALPGSTAPAGGSTIQTDAVRPARVDGMALVLVGRDDRPPAVLEDRCTHRGGPLHDGDVDDGCIRCPWHGSRFDLETGAVRSGPASVPQPVYETRVADGAVEIRRDEPGGLRTNPVDATDLPDLTNPGSAPATGSPEPSITHDRNEDQTMSTDNTDNTDVGDEVPTADALEQRREVDGGNRGDARPSSDSMEVPEADAIEQAQAVLGDEEH